MHSTFTWDRFDIDLTHCVNWLNTGFDHLEIRAEERIPITETGYKSHFIQPDELALFASPEDFVRQWLDEATASTEWKKYLKDTEQLSLF